MSRPKDPAEYMASLFDDDPRPDPTENRTSTGAGHPDTSHEAAARVEPKSGTQREQVLRFFYKNWPGGFTDEEVWIRMGLPYGSTLARRNELFNDGWLKDTGHRRKTQAGGNAIIWQYVPLKGEKL